VVPNSDLNVLRVVIRGQNKGSFSRHQEIDTIDLIALQEDVLVVSEYLRLQERTEPRYERGTSILKEFNFLVPVFVDVEGNFDSQFVGEVLDELVQVVDIFFVLIGQALLQPDVEI